MPFNDFDEDHYIAGQMEALSEERQAIQEQYNAGNISEKDYKTLLAKNDYLAAQIKERNQEQNDRRSEKTYERKRDYFND